MTRLTVVGGGKMGEALIGGLLGASWRAEDIQVVEPDAARREELMGAFEGMAVVATPTTVADALVAVKPQHCKSACEAIADKGTTRVLSIAAGVTTASLESWLAPDTPVVRCMPNTPALVGAGMSAIAPGLAAGSADLSWAADILAAVGEVITVDETSLDAVTGMSGSGPAYVFLLAEALVEAGVSVGLERGTADVLTRQTLLGAAKLLAESGEDPAVLRANVTSPGGTTAAGLAVFGEAGFLDLVERVVAAATQRSKALGGS